MENSQNMNEVVIKLELNVNEVNLVLGALRELPHRVSDEMIRKVVQQAQAQVNGGQQADGYQSPPSAFYDKQ